MRHRQLSGSFGQAQNDMFSDKKWLRELIKFRLLTNYNNSPHGMHNLFVALPDA